MATTKASAARSTTKPDARSTTPAQKKKASAAPAAKPKAPRKPRPPAITPEQRANYVEVAAYYIAERRGFTPGDPLADWVEAEAEIDRLLASGHFGDG